MSQRPPLSLESLAARVADLEDAARASRRPHPPITGRGYTQDCPCVDCRERQLEAVTKAFHELGKSHRETVDREIAQSEKLAAQVQQLKAMRACLVYARDRRGNHFDFDTWNDMVAHALDKGTVPPFAFEDAQSELLRTQQVLDQVRKDRDSMQAALAKARTEVVGLIGERDDASKKEREAIVRKRDLQDAMDIIACDLGLQPEGAAGWVVTKFQAMLAERNELKKALDANTTLMAAMGTDHWPRVQKNAFKQYQLVGCKCGFDTTSDDELIKHIATQQVLQGMPPAKPDAAPYTGVFKKENEAPPTFTIHESHGAHPDATLEVIDERTHFRVRVREPRSGKASIFLNDAELERVQLNIGFIRGRRIGQRTKSQTWCETCATSEPRHEVRAVHGEHWHDKMRWWCSEHVPMSGHYEHCPAPCRDLIRAVTPADIFADLARVHPHLRKP